MQSMGAPRTIVHFEKRVDGLDFFTDYEEGPKEDGGSFAWNEAIYAGTMFSSMRSEWSDEVRTHTYTDEEIDEMVETFALRLSWGPVAIDVNHANLWGALDADSSKALGYVRAVEKRYREDGAAALWVLCEWTAEGKRRIDSGEFEGWSSEIIDRHLSVDKTTGKAIGKTIFDGGTLTNSPFWPGLARVATSEDSLRAKAIRLLTESGELRMLAPCKQGEGRTMSDTITTEALRGALGLSDSKPIGEMLADVGNLRSALSDTKNRLGIAEEKISALSEERDRLREKMKTFEGLEEERIDAMFAEFVNEGRLLAKDRAKFDRTLGYTEGKAWSDRVAELRDTFEAGRVVEMGERGHDAGADADDEGDVFEKHAAEVDRLTAEGKTWVEATRLADKKFPAAIAGR